METCVKMKGKQMKNLWIPLNGLKTRKQKAAIVLFLAVSLCLCAIMSCPAAAQDEQTLSPSGTGQRPEKITSEPMNEGSAAPATTEAPTDVNSTQGPATRTRGFGPQLQLFFIIVMIIVVFMMFRGPRKKQAEHHKMVQSLKKNDRVRTIGGIYGTVVDVREDEIVLKIDESNNTKMRISPNAIGTKLSDEKS
jgi:preprotein translocase subunit YajC